MTTEACDWIATSFFRFNKGPVNGGAAPAAHFANGAESHTRGAEYVAALRSELHKTDKGADPNSFEVLALIFGFQGANVQCQLDNAKSILCSRLTRAESSAGGQPILSASDTAALTKLRDYRDELLTNYRLWCTFLGANPVHLAAPEKATAADVVKAPFGTDSYGQGAAMEIALTLLIWGEASNLRFCPEFLCWLYHKMAAELVTTMAKINIYEPVFNTFLADVIKPAYDMLAKEIGSAGHDVIDHTSVKQYDDFNESFWRRGCLSLDIRTCFTSGTYMVLSCTCSAA